MAIDEEKLAAEIEAALRTGNPDAAARVIVTHRNCSLDAARVEISQILAKRAKR